MWRHAQADNVVAHAPAALWPVNKRPASSFPWRGPEPLSPHTLLMGDKRLFMHLPLGNSLLTYPPLCFLSTAANSFHPSCLYLHLFHRTPILSLSLCHSLNPLSASSFLLPLCLLTASHCFLSLLFASQRVPPASHLSVAFVAAVGRPWGNAEDVATVGWESAASPATSQETFLDPTLHWVHISSRLYIQTLTSSTKWKVQSSNETGWEIWLPLEW